MQIVWGIVVLFTLLGAVVFVGLFLFAGVPIITGGPVAALLGLATAGIPYLFARALQEVIRIRVKE